MHIPNPLGGYPLILRQDTITNARNGELLYNYEKNDLYYVNKITGNKSLLAKEIYDKLIAAKLENTYIKAVKDSESVGSKVDIIPDIPDRKVNTFYMNICKKQDIEA